MGADVVVEVVEVVVVLVVLVVVEVDVVWVVVGLVVVAGGVDNVPISNGNGDEDDDGDVAADDDREAISWANCCWWIKILFWILEEMKNHKKKIKF